MLAAPSTALGDDERDARARALFETAASRIDAGDAEGALALYRQSYALVPRAKTLLNIGVALIGLRRNAEAANVLAEYIDSPDSTPERRAQVARTLAALDQHLGLMDVYVRGSGSVAIDGRRVGEAPLTMTLRVSPGTHVVTVTAHGQVARSELELAAGQLRTASLTAPEIRTFTEGNRGGPTGDGTSGKTRPRSDSALYSRGYLWTGLLTVGLASAGVVFGLQARSAEDDHREYNQDSTAHTYLDAEALGDRARSRALWANIGFAAAGTAALITGYLFLRHRSDRRKRSSAASLVPIRGGSLVTIAGGF